MGIQSLSWGEVLTDTVCAGAAASWGGGLIAHPLTLTFSTEGGVAFVCRCFQDSRQWWTLSFMQSLVLCSHDSCRAGCAATTAAGCGVSICATLAQLLDCWMAQLLDWIGL